MQFGIFTVGGLTRDPTNGHTVSEAQRINELVTIAVKAEEVGLDVFAMGEHHNPPFIRRRPRRSSATSPPAPSGCCCRPPRR
jgi:alkanesulfonate monooxygenase SsuD/methylene tetrahydromethanopterin reductase-like flavin-dependent oxidoreductase (luciferase family)